MIKLFYIAGFSFVTFLFSCKQPQQKTNLPIDEKELLNIMVDLTLAQSAVSNYPSSQKDSIRNVYKYQLEQIYQKSIIEIDSILNMVYKDVELNKKLQKQVLDTLKVLEEKTIKVK